jgi:hypothetical protein
MSDSASHCIFCRTEHSRRKAEEHILPHGLVGDRVFYREDGYGARLVLDHGEVCRDCNTGFSSLDSALQKSLGLLKPILNPVGTKRGRPARAQMPGVWAERRDNGPYFLFNSGAKPIRSPDGGLIHPAGVREDAARLEVLGRSDDEAELRVKTPFPFTKKAFRALHKIALELVCFEAGFEAALEPRFDAVREYVRRSKGSRWVTFASPTDLERVAEPRASVRRYPGGTIVKLTLGILIYVDLSSHNSVEVWEDNDAVGFYRVRDRFARAGVPEEVRVGP